jgi:1,4-dihydroxy-2-naphthoate octaprenyltransferase
MQFNPSAFVENLSYMGLGMLGIFIVIGVIILSVVVLNKATSPKPQKKDEE